MGKWIYINALVLLVSVVFMYLHFTNHYQPQLHVYILASLFWIIVYAAGHYIFIHKMRLEKKVSQAQAAESKISVHTATQSEKPKVVLKKERPKVNLKKKNDNNHGK